jgi:hypothetical protein
LVVGTWLPGCSVRGLEEGARLEGDDVTGDCVGATLAGLPEVGWVVGLRVGATVTGDAVGLLVWGLVVAGLPVGMVVMGELVVGEQLVGEVLGLSDQGCDVTGWIVTGARVGLQVVGA